jgi:hypothetical protein
MGNIRITRGVVGVKAEATYGTFGAPAATDSFPAFDIEVSVEASPYERNETSTHFGKQPSVPGMAKTNISFKVLGRETGATAATPPFFDLPLMGCGLQKGITAATKVDYKPWSTFLGATAVGPPATTDPSAGYSVAVWRDGVRFASKGSVGNLVISCKAGEPIEYAFSFQGAYVAPIDDAEVVPTLGLSVPAKPWLSATLLVQTYAAICSSFTLDLGNEITNKLSANDASGIIGCAITNRRVKAKIDPEMELIATHNFFGIWRSGATAALSWGPIPSGGAAGTKQTFTAALCQYASAALGERENLQTLDIDCALVTAGVPGDEFLLSFS